MFHHALSVAGAPLAADYDGDGKADPALYHTNTHSAGSGQTGDRYMMLSGSGYGMAAAAFGGTDYGPVGFGPGPEQGGF